MGYSPETNRPYENPSTRVLISRSQGVSLEQTISTIDLISEGPIVGLVDHEQSIFLNNDQIMGPENASLNNTINFLPNSNTVLLEKPLPITDVTNRYIRIFNPTPVISSAIFNSSTTSKELVLSISSNNFPSNNTGYVHSSTILRLVPDNSSLPTLTGYLKSSDSSTATIILNPGQVFTGSGTDNYQIYADEVRRITAYDPDTRILTVAGGTLSISVLQPIGNNIKCIISSVQEEVEELETYDAANYQQVTTQFRAGQPIQSLISQGDGGIGSQTITNNNFNAINLIGQTREPTRPWDIINLEGPEHLLLGTDNSGFGLSADQAAETDAVSVHINYPGGLYKEPAGLALAVTYRVKIEILQDGEWILKQTRRLVSSSTRSRPLDPMSTEVKTAFSQTWNFDLEQYKPFDNFRISVRRLSSADVDRPWGLIYQDDKFITQSRISSVSATIKEPLNYPYTAMGAVTFSSKGFSSLPTRGYHCRGLIVDVPSNYVTREESSTSVANYNRNPSTGTITSSYQNWDGTFRKAYTNNPAWIFRDIIVNNRYGIGDWVTEDDIDIYSLYRIARYCDEQVPDGDGGLEPRFTANLYLFKAQDVYKVLKDMATIFASILYWSEGQVLPVVDQAKDPVMNFDRANVVDGTFNYETTGSTTRPNQAIVAWNDPDKDYTIQTVLVEDTQNILDTGTIIRENVTAFGCTSRGQATRYGRWKLWTAINQTEIVTFQTSLNAGFLGPGDIINVIDSDRHAGVSGVIREVDSSTRWITVDRSDLATLFTDNFEGEDGEPPNMLIQYMVSKPTAFLAQDIATIDNVEYSQGDPILPDTELTEETAANLLDDSGNPVLTSWNNYSYLEKQTVAQLADSVSLPGYMAGDNNVIRIATDAPLPEEGSLYSILYESGIDGRVLEGAEKAYKILTITEDDTNLSSITAVEHFNEKFDNIEQNFNLYQEDEVLPRLKTGDTIPPVTGLVVSAGSPQDDTII